MIFIYGENDPWTAAGVTWLKEKKNIHVIHSAGRQPSRTHLHTARKGERRSDEAAKRMVAVNAPVSFRNILFLPHKGKRHRSEKGCLSD